MEQKNHCGDSDHFLETKGLMLYTMQLPALLPMVLLCLAWMLLDLVQVLFFQHTRNVPQGNTMHSNRNGCQDGRRGRELLQNKQENNLNAMSLRSWHG